MEVVHHVDLAVLNFDSEMFDMDIANQIEIIPSAINESVLIYACFKEPTDISITLHNGYEIPLIHEVYTGVTNEVIALSLEEFRSGVYSVKVVKNGSFLKSKMVVKTKRA